MRALVVDDHKTMRAMLQAQLKSLGYNTSTACDGKEAWDIIQREYQTIDVVLLDREMPVMNGLEVVALMKANPKLKNIPVIMQTASDSPVQVQEGIDAGVFYYLTKPFNEAMLKSVLSAAIRELHQHKILQAELKLHHTSFNLLDTCRFYYKTLPEAEGLSCFLANCYPNPERVVGGLAELLINAVEHGNLGIAYTEKTWLIKTDTWHDEVMRRIDLPEFKEKRVEVLFSHADDGTYIRITDEGKGFDWKKFLEIDPSRSQDNHGRGIALAKAISFDSITYNAAGNRVTAFISDEAELN